MHNNKLLNIKHRKLGHIMSPIESNVSRTLQARCSIIANVY
jgi:hypothetical protein